MSNEQNYKNGENAVSQPFDLRPIFVRRFALPGSQVGDPVLKHAQGADDGAIHTSKNERQQHQGHNDAHVHRQHGRQELHFGHPAQVRVQRSREIQ